VGVSVARRAEALSLFRRGNAHFTSARFAEALKEYRRAVRIWDHPSIRYNMAVCYIHRDQHQRAWRSLTAALRHGQGPLSTARYTRAKTYQRLLRGRLAFVEISCAVPGAEVVLDGERVPEGPGHARRALLPGEHLIVATRRGYATSRQQLRLEAGSHTRVRMVLLRLGDAFDARRRWRPFLPWTVLGAGAAVALTGLGLLLGGNAEFARYNKRFSAACPDGCVSTDPTGDAVLPQIPSRLVSLERRARGERAGGIALLAAGGAAAVVGLVLAILNRPHQIERLPRNEIRSGPLTLIPVMSPVFAGLTARLQL